jgi:cysteine-rich repeat protein
MYGKTGMAAVGAVCVIVGCAQILGIEDLPELPDALVARCGDGVLSPGETCDDGNTEPGDGCSATCQIEECGNGVRDPGEDAITVATRRPAMPTAPSPCAVMASSTLLLENCATMASLRLEVAVMRTVSLPAEMVSST